MQKARKQRITSVNVHTYGPSSRRVSKWPHGTRQTRDCNPWQQGRDEGSWWRPWRWRQWRFVTELHVLCHVLSPAKRSTSWIMNTGGLACVSVCRFRLKRVALNSRAPRDLEKDFPQGFLLIVYHFKIQNLAGWGPARYLWVTDTTEVVSCG